MTHQPDLSLFTDGALVGAERKDLASAIPQDNEPERWSSDDPVVIIREQPAIRVYQNQFEEIVIMRKAYGDDDDECVYILPENLPRLIAALQRYLPR